MSDHQRLIADVQRDAPTLVWVMQLALDNGIPLNPKLEAVAALKKAILKKPGSETQWRLLCHSRQEDFGVVLNHPSTELRWQTLRQWLRFLEDIGASRQLPAPVVELLLNALIVYIGHMIDVGGLRRMYPIPVLRIMARECQERAGLRADLYQSFVADEVALVLEWSGKGKIALDRNQEKSGWRYLLRRARDWQHRTLHKSLLGMESVPDLIDQRNVGEYVVKPLNSAYLMWEEGFAMRHCVGSLWQLALNETSRFYSIRARNSDDRVATLEIQNTGNGWKVFDCRKYCNFSADSEMLRVGQQVAELHNQAQRRTA
jgi:hypothetical protein